MTRWRWCALASCALLVSACGVRLQDEPQQIDRRDVPYGLLEPRDVEFDESSSFVVYFLRGDVAVAVPRVASTAATPEAVMESLLRGPASGESAAGLRTSIPGGTTLQALEREGRLITVDLSAELSRASDLAAAVRQIDTTLRDLPGVEDVVVLIDGVAVTTTG